LPDQYRLAVSAQRFSVAPPADFGLTIINGSELFCLPDKDVFFVAAKI
jgi:hypothetical protein